MALDANETRPIKYRTGVIDNQNPAKSLAHVAFSPGDGDGTVLHDKKFKGVADLSVGEIIDVGFFAGEDRARRWRKAEKILIDGFCVPMKGQLTQRPGNSFGFLMTKSNERVFVHPDLMGSVPKTDDVTDLSCIAMMGKDK